MLTHVHVKNLALIDEAEVDFDEGLNILTGETGAGKSILIGAVGMALGKKTSRDMIREGEKEALAELLFAVESDEVKEALKNLDIEAEDDQVIISRRLSGTRSICKINGETTTAAKVREAAAHLLDIHGQHEHQSLLYKDQQLAFLDAYDKEKTDSLKAVVAADYKTYKKTQKELDSLTLDEEQQKRQLDFLTFEVEEIDGAGLKKGEDEQLEGQFKKMANSQKITEALQEVYEMTGSDSMAGAGNAVSYALQSLSKVASLDESLSGFYDTLSDMESILSDFNRDLSSYLSDMTFSEEEFSAVSERLDLINHLKSKYGNSIEKIFACREEKSKELERLQNFETYKNELEASLKKQEKALKKSSEALTKERKSCAETFEKKLTEHLLDLNFNDVRFQVNFQPAKNYSANGADDVTFMISTNPGEPMRELAGVVSGGELSRIMLGIRCMMAEQEGEKTLIFDEIDTGISGRTAQKVAEKMALISRSTQVLCITHLPQIAAMADHHFEISKSVEQGISKTDIHSLSHEEACEELARMLGGTEITKAVRDNAVEMKRLADACKSNLQ